MLRNKPHGLIIVPPLLKSRAGPLLGPALLSGAARSQHLKCRVLDLNANFFLHELGEPSKRGMHIGDHDKPPKSTEGSLDVPERKFYDTLAQCLRDCGGSDSNSVRREAVRFGYFSHSEASQAAQLLSQTELGVWLQQQLMDDLSTQPVLPHVVGLSLMHAGQVLPALTIAKVCRDFYRLHNAEVIIAFGGAHIAALRDPIFQAPDLYRLDGLIDTFVCGHAEGTFVDLLVASQHRRVVALRPAMIGDAGASSTPHFENLHLYGPRLTLPVQSAVGCAYGRCQFCTYPSIEPKPRKHDLAVVAAPVVALAHSLNAALSFKDSLVTPERLLEIAAVVKGRANWSVCTKISDRLTEEKLIQCAAAGLRTLEVGVETLDPESQRFIDKFQPQAKLYAFLKRVAAVPDLTLVANYITRFPWERKERAEHYRNEVAQMLQETLGDHRSTLEHNFFELQRLAPIHRTASTDGGLEIGNLRYHPWASTVQFDRLTPY